MSVEVVIRDYKKIDLPQLIEVYQSAFAEPPWNEYKKCLSCGVEYDKQEVLTVADSCKKCNEPLELADFWSADDVKQDLEFALSQQEPIILVAENSDGLAGFAWGYMLPFEKFPFLSGKVEQEASYMDEIAVKGDKRLKGIGTQLGRKYLEAAKERASEVVLRTDERNVSSMSLFRKLGFSNMPDSKNPKGNIYDPVYQNRIYLKKDLGE